MGFLSPLLLTGLLALSVPLWLHLRRRRRHTPIEFPSLRYLHMAAARMKRQARVEDLSLLILRLLLLALLATAFARPVVRSHGSWLGSARSTESVILIDATASMAWRGESGSRFDAAKRLANEWIQNLDAPDAVAIWVLTDRLEKPVPLPIVNRSHLFRTLDALEVSEGSCPLAPAFHAAREWARSRGNNRKELVVITDNQNAAWDWPADGFFRNAWDRKAMHLVVLSPDSSHPSNISLESVEWNARSARGGDLLTGIATIVNHGDTPAVDVLECVIDGQSIFRKPVELAATGSLDIPLSIPVPATDAPVLAGKLSLAGDAFTPDDHWHFALPLRRPLSALIVDREGVMGGAMRPSFFLTKAIAAGAAGTARAIESGAWTTQSTAEFTSLWFTAGAIADAAAWTRALAFASGGGTVVVTGDTQPDPLPDGWPVSAGAEITLPAGRVATRILAPSHPLFEGIWNGQTPFPPFSQNTVRDCQPAPGARSLASLAGAYPLVVERPHGKGRVLWLNSSVDRSWGDLPLSPVFVPLAQQFAHASELSKLAATSGWVGEAWPELSSIAPDASWPPGDDGETTLRATRSGIFHARSGDGTSVWTCAVNVRRAESDLRPVDPVKLSALLPGRLAEGTTGIREWRREIRREVPLWPWLLAAAALAYLAEGWLSARSARKRQPSGLTSGVTELQRKGACA